MALSNVLIGFKEFPHTDFVERGAEVVDLLLRMICKEIRPVTSVFDCRMIDVLPTSWEPMRGFVDRLIELERNDPRVLNAWVNHGFMAGDAPELGVKMVVITDDAKAHGDVIAEKLGHELFANRGKSMPTFLEVDAAIDKALADSGSGKPAVIAEFWDNPGGGTAGDATIILRRLMERRVQNAAVGTIWDPMAVKLASVAGEGAVVPLRFGAKSAPHCGDPIDAIVTVKRIVKDARQTFGASIVGIGDAVLVDAEGIDVILNSVRAQAFERTIFSALGVSPETKDLLVIKSSTTSGPISPNSAAKSFIAALAILIRMIQGPMPIERSARIYGRESRIRSPLVLHEHRGRHWRRRRHRYGDLQGSRQSWLYDRRRGPFGRQMPSSVGHSCCGGCRCISRACQHR